MQTTEQGPKRQEKLQLVEQHMGFPVICTLQFHCLFFPLRVHLTENSISNKIRFKH